MRILIMIKINRILWVYLTIRTCFFVEMMEGCMKFSVIVDVLEIVREIIYCIKFQNLRLNFDQVSIFWEDSNLKRVQATFLCPRYFKLWFWGTYHIVIEVLFEYHVFIHGGFGNKNFSFFGHFWAKISTPRENSDIR